MIFLGIYEDEKFARGIRTEIYEAIYNEHVTISESMEIF